MEEQEFTRCRDDVTYFVRRYCQIRHPLRGAVAFALWDWQADLLDMLTREQLLIVLKARQLGVSELAAAYALWRARFVPGWLGLLVSRNQSDASDLLDRIGFMYDHLPPWLQATSARTGRGTATRQREHTDDDVMLPVDGLNLRKRNTSVLEFGHVSADGVVPKPHPILASDERDGTRQASQLGLSRRMGPSALAVPNFRRHQADALDRRRTLGRLDGQRRSVQKAFSSHKWSRKAIDAWSIKYRACVHCGKTDSPHRAKGLCRRCYWLVQKK